MYMCDFETTTDTKDCRVWAAGMIDIETQTEYHEFNNIADFMCTVEGMSKTRNLTLYFHNLKFDGEFIISWLFNHGWIYTDNRKMLSPKSFCALIGDMGQFYSMELMFYSGTRRGRVKILDSLKILNMSVADISRAFGCKYEKGEIDYKAYRPIGWEITKDESSYLKRDCIIPAFAINQLISSGHDKMTAGSNALAEYKRIIGKDFEKYFPPIDCDEFCRKSYKGGWTYCNPKHINKDIGNGRVYDTNSMYPWVMWEKMLPYGKPEYFIGEYKEDKVYTLYIQRFECSFELKPGKLPCVQEKHNIAFNPREYLTSSEGEIVEMTMTSVDHKLFLENYEVKDYVDHDGYKFRSSNQLFKEYIDKWIAEKIDAGKIGNKGKRQIAKLMLNSLYGKFAKRGMMARKIPYLADDGIVKYKLTEEEESDLLYLPVGTFVTAYARDLIIRSAQKFGDRFLYADTDSLHVIDGEDGELGLHIDDFELGAWKEESVFKRARYLGPKAYIEQGYRKNKAPKMFHVKHCNLNGTINVSHETLNRCYKIEVKCAGLPHYLHDKINWNNFRYDLTVFGKLRYIHCPGGVVLEESTYNLKNRLTNKSKVC